MNVWKSVKNPSVLVIWLALSICEAHAGFITKPPPSGNPRPDEQGQDWFHHTWAWDLTNNLVNPFQVAGPSWFVQVESGGNIANKTGTLELNGVHMDRPHYPDAERGDPFQVRIDGLGRPLAGKPAQGTARAVQVDHPETHYDVAALSVTIRQQGIAAVSTWGKHNATSQATWSYTPHLAGSITVDASYRTGDNRRVQGNMTVNPLDQPQKQGEKGGYVENTLTPAGETRKPTDYIVTFTANPTTTMTLAFPGEVNGVPGRLDLAAGFDLFGGDIIAPMLLDAEAAPEDLYVGVNLVEWLSFQTPFSAFDVFDVVDGISDALPGFLFSNVPLSTDGNGGFLANSLWSGRVFVAGTVDGHVVPEPSALALVGIGMFSLLAWRRRLPHRPIGAATGYWLACLTLFPVFAAPSDAGATIIELPFAQYGKVPNLCPPNAGICGAAAAINSFVFLRDTYPENYRSLIPDWDKDGDVDEGDQIESRDFLANGWSDTRTGMYGPDGGTAKSIWEYKNYWFDDFAPGTTKFSGQIHDDVKNWYRGEMLVGNKYPEWDFLWRELLDGEDIELIIYPKDGGTGHAVTLTGLYYNDKDGNGRWDSAADELAELIYLDPNDVTKKKYATLSAQDGRLEFTRWQDNRVWYVQGAFSESVPLPTTSWLLLSGTGAWMCLIGCRRRNSKRFGCS